LTAELAVATETVGPGSELQGRGINLGDAAGHRWRSKITAA